MGDVLLRIGIGLLCPRSAPSRPAPLPRMRLARRDPFPKNAGSMDPESREFPAPSAASAHPPVRWWQRLLLIGFAFVVLAILELLLRVAHYGPDTRFVVTRLTRDDGSRIEGINPEAYRRFHFRLQKSGDANMGLVQWREFIDPKPEDGFRIFFLGGSTVQGYPHLRNACAPAFLEVILQKMRPDRRIEVINAGVTAINTFSIREWTNEILEHGPDLLVVYAGHNEFYGAYGAGSTSSIGTNRKLILAHLAVRRLKIARMLTDMINGIPFLRPKSGGGLMERVVEKKSIPYDDPIRRACRANFEANLLDIVESARRKGVPILLCGLVSNERDLAPFVSVHPPDLPSDAVDRFDEFFSIGMEAVAAGRFSEGLASFNLALRIDPGYAAAVYRKARCLERLGRIDEARAAYRRARDLDALPFRAPADFTETIREVCAKTDAQYVDVPAAFEAAAGPGGLIGWNLMTDHLHPTMPGHFVLAEAVAREVLPRIPGPPGAPDGPWPSYREVADELGLDRIDEMMWKVTVYLLTGRFPYAGTPNEEWHRRLEREILAWQASLTGPMKEGHAEWSEADEWNTIHYYFGRAFFRHGEFEEALGWYRKADDRSEPHSAASARARVGIVRCLDAMGSPETAAAAARTRRYLEECVAMHPDRRGTFETLEELLPKDVGSASP